MDILKIYKEAEKLGIHSLRPFQELIIISILESIENGSKIPLLATLPTGGGKSLCFTIPALISQGITIIVYPIKALMHDQASYFKKKNIGCIVLEGGMSKEAIKKEFERLKTKKAKIIITNIEMLSNPEILLSLRLFNISLFVVDEAHTVITWGESFRKSYLKIGQIAEFLGSDMILAFTATTNEYINERIKEVLFLNNNYHFILGGSNRSNLIFHTKLAISKKAEIMNILNNKALFPSIIFVQRREDAEKLHKFFKKYFDAKYYHAQLEKEKKIEIENWFLKSNTGLLIATCAYGLGVNKSNVRSVIHYSLPQSETDYLQESGRGGRDGKIAHAFALIDDYEESKIKSHFIGQECIRASLIKAMGQSYGESCTGCSICLGENIKTYAYEIRLIKFIRRRILPISYNKVLDRVLTELKPVLPYYTREEAKKLLNHLIKCGKVKKIIYFLH